MMTQQSQQHEHEHEDDDTPAGFQIPDRLLSNSVKPLVFPDTYNTSTTQKAPTQLLSPSTGVEDAHTPVQPSRTTSLQRPSSFQRSTSLHREPSRPTPPNHEHEEQPDINVQRSTSQAS
jgi:hypothetical protein